jgi:hypothetical protein
VERVRILYILVVLPMLVLSAVAFASPPWKVWAWDPTHAYPTVFATANSVLVGTAFGENFEHSYPNKETLEEFLIESILEISVSTKPRIALYASGNGTDRQAIENVMDGFISEGRIMSYNSTPVSPSNPLDVDVESLMEYDVVLLDAATVKSPAYQFDVTDESRQALIEYLERGGKMVASAYIFVNWYDYSNWGRELYNLDLAILFDGAKPDITTYVDRAITDSPFSIGETVETFNVYEPPTYDPMFHFFWRITTPEPNAPTAEFTLTPETASVGESVEFNASASLPGWNGTHEMPITEYHWDFGDSNQVATFTPIVYHSFSSSGIYYVTLTVYAHGATPETDAISHKVTVTAIPVGGYSTSIQLPTRAKPATSYIALLTIITTIFITIRRKPKKNA